ncbi:MAG TPA: hypothetical protein VFY13_05615, partial [Luteolibacter sp.]|nr:hypothetical protein [Luteolibacter sp.]
MNDSNLGRIVMFRGLLVILIGLCAGLLHADQAALIAYRFDPSLPQSAVYQVSADGTRLTTLQTQRGAILSFGMKRELELAVKLGRKPKKVVVRPLSAGVVAELQDDGLRLRLPKPLNLSVEVDGNIDDPLLVFANPE